MATRRRRLTGALLIVALVAPLFWAGVAVARGPACHEGRPPASSQDAAPCHGTPLLYCCDDAVTAPDSRAIQPDLSPRTDLALASVAVCQGASALLLAPVRDELRWRASPLRFSVVLRL